MRGIVRPTKVGLDKFFAQLNSEPFLKNLPRYRCGTKDIHYALLGHKHPIIAYCWLRGWDDNWPDKCLGLVVHPECRSMGYGELLTRFVLQAGKERNIARVRLHVHPDNKAALSLYKKLNFAFDGTKRADGELVGFYCYD